MAAWDSDDQARLAARSGIDAPGRALEVRADLPPPSAPNPILDFRAAFYGHLRKLACASIILLIAWLATTPAALALSGTVVAWGATNGAVNAGQANVPAGLTNCQAIAAGAFHSLAVRTDGTVVGWGYDAFGQATPPAWLTNVVAVACGAYDSLALRADGTVVAWGANDAYQTNVPPGLAGVWAIAAGDAHNLALLSDTTVVSWGSAGYPSRFPPSGVPGIYRLAAGASHSLIMDGYRRVYHYGNTASGLGQVPAQFASVGSSAEALAAGLSHSLVLTTNGLVYGWGDNYLGQANPPAGLSGVAAIAAAYNHSLALKSDGTVVAWGDNTAGQINVPTNLAHGARIAAGWYHSLAIYQEPVTIDFQPQGQTLLAGGTVTFRVNARGSLPLSCQWRRDGVNLPNATNLILTLTNVQAGDAGAYTAVISNPVGPVSSSNAVLTVLVPPAILVQPQSLSLPLGNSAEFRVTATGTLPLHYQWRKNGVNLPGAVATNHVIYVTQVTDAGDYTVTVSNVAGVVTSAVAVLIINLPPVIIAQPQSQTVAAGSSVTFGVVATGAKSYQWRKNGANISGATNAFFTLNSAQPADAGNYSVVIMNLGGTVVSSNATLTVITMTPSYNLVGWGQQTEVWNGSSYIDLTPPGGLSNLTALAVGGFHTLVLRRDGSVAGWGDNQYGQAVAPGGGYQAIAAGTNHSLALQSNGTVAAWGWNIYGQTNVPAGLTNLMAIAAGGNHNLALRRDGGVVAWGLNTYGQTNPPPSATNLVALAAGFDHSLALRANGTVIGWGRNEDGQTRAPTTLSNGMALAAGFGHSLALLSNGTVVAWGRNNYGQASVPAGLPRVIAIAAGANHSLALLRNNTVVCWGANNDGQCEVPSGLQGVAAIAGGPTRSLALRLKPLRLLLPQRQTAGQYRLFLANLDGSPLEPDRLANLEIYAASQAASAWAQWTRLSGATLVGDKLQVDDPASATSVCRQYLAVERP